MREISSESQNLNWVAHWLLSPPQGINAVTVNLIGCIEELSPHEINKPVAMFITNNIIPCYNSEISAFMFPFGVWLSNLRLNFEITEATSDN